MIFGFDLLFGLLQGLITGVLIAIFQIPLDLITEFLLRLLPSGS